MQRKMSPNTDLQDMACMKRKRPQGNSERKKVRGTAKVNVGAGKKPKE
jgi:hypothetical protein